MLYNVSLCQHNIITPRNDLVIHTQAAFRCVKCGKKHSGQKSILQCSQGIKEQFLFKAVKTMRWRFMLQNIHSLKICWFEKSHVLLLPFVYQVLAE